MRFVVLTQYFFPEVGATQARLDAVCTELIREGHEVEVVTAMPHHPAGQISPAYRGKLYARDVRNGATIHRVWLYATNGSGIKRILSYLSFTLTSLFGLVRAKRPDYLFVDSPPLTLAISARVASGWWRCPLILNVADLWPDSARDLGVISDGALLRTASMLEKWIYRRAARVTAVTEGIRTALVEEKRVPAEKILFLPNGVDTRLIRPLPDNEELRRQLGLVRKKVVLYAGNHGYAGALDQVLDAANALTHHERIHFLLIGDGPQKAHLKTRAREMGLNNITFLDSVPLDELSRFISLADCAIVTLRRAKVMRGARPAKALVMMAAAKPLVLAAEGEAAELVTRAEAGFVVPPENPPALARAIRTLLADPAEAHRMGMNGRLFIQNNLEWRVLVREWLTQLTGAPNLTAIAPDVITNEKRHVQVSGINASV
ncbi:MAG: glycosyltransferase family 4 protein [Candidatus Acidiferrales bacterium]